MIKIALKYFGPTIIWIIRKMAEVKEKDRAIINEWLHQQDELGKHTRAQELK